METKRDEISIGNVHILALSDGIGKRQVTDLFPEVPVANLLNYSDTVSPNGTINYKYGSFIINSGTETILVDTGMGPNLPGTLIDQLHRNGLSNDQITIVINTHLHPDHVGWNITWKNSKPYQTFPKARYYLPKVDWEHFNQERNYGRFQYINDSIKPLEQLGNLHLVEGKEAITKEISLIPTPGHTPGHMSISILSNNQQGIILGDVTHFPFQGQETAWEILFDMDKKQARETRETILDQIEKNGSLVGAGHFANTFGYFIRRSGRRYWQPLT